MTIACCASPSSPVSRSKNAGDTAQLASQIQLGACRRRPPNLNSSAMRRLVPFLMAAALALAAAPPVHAQQPPVRLTIWNLKLGTPLGGLPPLDAFKGYACGSNGAPPRQQIKGWA